MIEQALFTVAAILPTVSGGLDSRAEWIRRHTGKVPRQTSWSDCFLAMTLLVPFLLSAFWLWRTWQWYETVSLLAAVWLLGRFAVTKHFTGRWSKMRPSVALCASILVSILWSLSPPP